jgi:hypothetical protein
MPPGFIRAIWALLLCVQASWASAITSPSADSPLAPVVRVMSAVMLPTTLLAIGATAVRYLSATFFAFGSTVAGFFRNTPLASLSQPPLPSVTPFSTTTFLAVTSAKRPVRWSIA